MKVINDKTIFVDNFNVYDLAENERIFEVMIKGVQFLATGKGNLYKSEKTAIDKVAQYCVKNDMNSQYRDKVLIYNIDDLAIQYWKPNIYEMTDEELMQFIENDFIPCCNYHYFIERDGFDIVEVTDEVIEDNNEMRNDVGKVFDSFYGDKEKNILKRMKEEGRKMKHRKTLKEDFTTDYTATFLPTTTAATDNANSVEEYLGTLMQSVVETWGLHLNTNKYSEHIALNEFYDEMIDLVDTLIENYKGIYGNIPTKPNVFKPEATSAAEYLREFRAFVENGKSLFTDSELLSDIDSILSAIDECLYKVENLTESRKRKMMKEDRKEYDVFNGEFKKIENCVNELCKGVDMKRFRSEFDIFIKEGIIETIENYIYGGHKIEYVYTDDIKDVLGWNPDEFELKHRYFYKLFRVFLNETSPSIPKYDMFIERLADYINRNYFKDKESEVKNESKKRKSVNNILKEGGKMRRKRTIRESVSNETIYIDKERIPTAHYVFDVRIGDTDFIVTSEDSYGDAESEAIDKVVEYCINSIDNEDYYDLLPIFTYEDVIEDFKDFEFDDPDYADEAINDYIMNDFTVALDSNYFIPNHEISVKDVTQSMRRSFRNRRSY